MLKVTQSPEGSELVSVTRRRSFYRRIAASFGIFVLVISAIAGGLYWQATRASIGLSFLNSRVETGIEERLPPDARVTVGSTAFSYRSGEGIVLRIRDIQLALPGTATVAAKEVSTSTTARALLSGRIDLQTVTVSDIAIGVSAAPRLAREGSGADLLRRASIAFMDQVLQADDLMRATGLQEVVVNEATIHLDEQGRIAGPSLKVSAANWRPLGEGRSKAWMQFVEKSGSDWDVTLERRRARGGETTLGLEIEDLPVTTLAPRLSGANGGPYYRSTITLQARIAKKPDGEFMGVRGALSTGEGELSLTGSEPVNLEAAALTFILEPTGDRIGLPSAEVRTLAGRIQLEGVVDLAELGKFTLITRVRGGALPTPIGDAKSIEILGGGGLARFDYSNLGIEVERFDLMTHEGVASLIGQASFTGATPGVSFALSFDKMSAAAVRALWPPFVATKTRGWFDLNVKGGTLGPATLQGALPPDHIGPRNRGKVLPSTALVGTLPFENAEFTPIRTFPPIKNAVGGITFGNATASIWAQSGIVEVAGKGSLQAGGTTFIIPELGRNQPRGDLHLELTGSASALATVSDTPPLSIARKHSIVATSISGEAALSLDASIPIYQSDFADVIPTFRLALTDFTSTSPIDTRLIGDANLVLEGSPKSYTVKGTGTLDGYDATVDLILGTAAPDTSAVSIELDDAARERLGFGFGRLLTGPVYASLTQPGAPRQQVALDLKDSRINLPFLGWEKGPGVPATASFIMEKTPIGTEITNFLLSGKGFEARGALSIGTDGRLKAIDLERVALRSGDQLQVSATANGNGYDVTVRGAVLDARGIIQGVRSGGTSGDADIFPINVSLSVEVVKGQNDVALSNVAGNLTITKNGLDAASLKGNTNDNQPFEWTLGREGKTRVLRLFADGGGALVRFSGIYSRAAGGNLIIDYSGPVGGAGAGVAVMRDFRLINETALKSAVRTATPREQMVQAYAEEANDLHFSQLRIPFQQEGWVITIDDAALRGSMLGATASGTINLPEGNMAISGTFIPAFGINNIAGAIPILGAILGGGRDEGLVGITYKLFGAVDNPKLVMNPISAIAPGIFRKIFEYR